MPDSLASATPAAVLDFWLADGLARGWPSQDMGPRWFTGGPALDAKIREKFGAQVDAALAGGLGDWEANPLDRLALLILLDQFPRNIHRGQAEAFAGDTRAQQLVMDALALGMDQQLPWVGRTFLYAPRWLAACVLPKSTATSLPASAAFPIAMRHWGAAAARRKSSF
jgi:uncharacterized protein (DUF924 family)